MSYIRIKHTTLFLALILWAAACSPSYLPDRVDTGSEFGFIPDGPDFVIAANPAYSEDGTAYLSTTVDLLVSSLIFRRSDDNGQAADVVITYTLLPQDAGDEAEPVNVIRKSEEFSFSPSSNSIIPGYQRERVDNRFAIDPGDYVLQVTVHDQTSNQQNTRVRNVSLPDSESNRIRVSDINIKGIPIDRDEDPYGVGTYNIPSSIDSLDFSFFVINPDDSGRFILNMRLIRFESDLRPAGGLSEINRSVSSLERRGINYGNAEIISEQIREFTGETGAIEINFNVPLPEIGNYRFEVFVTQDEDQGRADALRFVARDFGVRTSFFPEVVEPYELAAPLIYLMNNRRYRELMKKRDDPEELLRAVEYFWVSNLGSTEKARRVMALYYERVVNANRRFTTFKEGWKTDLGMIFILFGPPFYAERIGSSGIRWTYGYDSTDPTRVFLFRQTRIGSDRFPFNHFTLERQSFYHNVQYQRVQDWLSGHVLERQFPF